MSKIKHKLKKYSYRKKNFWQESINHLLKDLIIVNPYYYHFFHYRCFAGIFIYPKNRLCLMSYSYHRHSKTIIKLKGLHIETYRCKCGSLGRVGYLCCNKECSEV